MVRNVVVFSVEWESLPASLADVKKTTPREGEGEDDDARNEGIRHRLASKGMGMERRLETVPHKPNLPPIPQSR